VDFNVVTQQRCRSKTMHVACEPLLNMLNY
jgi:hypothetical protein